MDSWHHLLFLSVWWSLRIVPSFACHRVHHGDCQLLDHCHLVCVGASPTTLHGDISKNITNVTLCAWPYKTFKVAKHMGHLRDVEHFTLRHSDVEHIESFHGHRALQTVNLTELQLTQMERDVFSQLPVLHSVDLRHNRLSYLDYQIFSSLPALHTLYLAGNNWTCDPRLIWIISDAEGSIGSKVLDKQELFCEGKSKAMPKPLVQVMQFVKVMQAQCPHPCNCSVDHVVRAYTYLVTERGKLLPHIKVNCNRRNLTSMPDHLPDYTTALFLRNNNLTSVEELVFNKHYKDVREIYLDNNQISAINILEGSHWLNNFGVLNLRGNRLRQIPIYALDHAFISQKLSHIFLGNNPWRCDCEFTIHFKNFLKKYSGIIKDLEDIRCQKVYGDMNSNKMIVNLDRSDLCHNQDSLQITFIDKVNIFLACMIFLVISTFLYNLTVYKTTGKLPWMVAKLF
ncbi:protein singed wings 2 isoform X2 [Homalodisca vitripennis]|uniref:protein singed wings 2 isoform X2 n=1 Tax=Homalodisca vitripennis TaxID=197043 RepID=UPI001EECBEF4|nr:protein singed wings 2 isoform X2 [Homalodisca vitripennis]